MTDDHRQVLKDAPPELLAAIYIDALNQIIDDIPDTPDYVQTFISILGSASAVSFGASFDLIQQRPHALMDVSFPWLTGFSKLLTAPRFKRRWICWTSTGLLRLASI